MNSGSDYAENCTQIKTIHSGLVYSQNAQIVLPSEFRQLSTYVKKRSLRRRKFKKIVEKYCLFFNKNAVSLFREIGDQGRYALLCYCRTESKIKAFTITRKMAFVQPEILDSCFSRESVENGASKIKSIVRGGHIKHGS